MSDAQVPPDISAEDWAATPAAVQALVLSLLQRLADLEERLHRSSRNSSKPPSSDPPHASPRPPRTPSGRKRGGQKGHPGQGRALTPPQHLDRIIELEPVSCAACGALLLGTDAHPARHQVSDLPPVQPTITEYRRHRLTCLACGSTTQAAWPAQMPAGSFGPRLVATVGYVTGRLGVSQRDATEMLATLFPTDLALGSVPALEQQVSAALAEPVEAVQTYAQAQPAVNLDETSWREAKKRTWLWVMATGWVTLLRLLPSRGRASVGAMLGEGFGGIVGSDRWGGYNGLAVSQRQVCWAHLKRDFQALLERGGESAVIGAALLEQVGLLFGVWRQVGEGRLSQADFAMHMQPIQARVGELLRQGTQVAQAKTRRTCENILKLEGALWTFVGEAGVEPTNNAAERPLRRAVIWRRRSFGTQSETGSRFVERILTAVTTLRQQERDVLDYLT